MNVFVLGTGRCGSVTFSEACQHLTNYTAGHESKSSRIGPKRFEFDPNHIEIDNRLSWTLGTLGARWDDEDVFYVHLRRDRDAVAASYRKRWNSKYRASIIRAFRHGVVQRVKDYPDERQMAVCRYYVDTVTANVDEFIKNRPSMTMHLETIADDFPRFLDRIGAEGDLEAANGEWQVRHNASKSSVRPSTPGSK